MHMQQYEKKMEDVDTSDGFLIQQALAGDQEAFEALVYRYRTLLLQHIFRYVGEYEEARDVLQQVWLQLYLSLNTLRVKGPIKPWLYKVAHNCSVDTLRRKRLIYFAEVEAGNEEGEASLLDTILDTSPTPEERAERHDLQRSVRRAIQAIPYAYRPVILLRYGDQLNFPEIGRILNKRDATVKTQFYRAKSLLRAALAEQL